MSPEVDWCFFDKYDRVWYVYPENRKVAVRVTEGLVKVMYEGQEETPRPEDDDG